jgi:putative transposase
MDEPHLITALRYVSLNPVRAHLVSRPQQWKWSSVKAHLAASDDGLVTVGPALKLLPDFDQFLGRPDTDDFTDLRRAESTGRPAGTEDFVDSLERLLGRPVARRAPGRTAQANSVDQMTLL